MHHECEVAAATDALGTVDTNTGDELIGWDTDQFPTSLYLTTQVMEAIVNSGSSGAPVAIQSSCERPRPLKPISLMGELA